MAMTMTMSAIHSRKCHCRYAKLKKPKNCLRLFFKAIYLFTVNGWAHDLHGLMGVTDR